MGIDQGYFAVLIGMKNGFIAHLQITNTGIHSSSDRPHMS
jgi:hypothetical protein